MILEQLDPRGGQWITAMTQSMHHRGPDDGGAVVFGLGGRPVIERRLGRADETVHWDYLPVQTALGARRLAVLDPGDAARQPMVGDSVWLIFNGAIYNFRELRRELEAAGMVFRSRGDTEVVLAAYRHWGIDCFDRFDGMWAAAVYDSAAGRIVLSRDPLGIKPLYLTRCGKGWAFASEIKALLTLPGVRREAEPSLLCDFLARGLTDHTDRTFFEGVWSAPPGCCLTFDLRGGVDHPLAALHPYGRSNAAVPHHSLPAAPGLHAGSTGQPLRPQRLLSCLRAAVRRHLVSDVAVGSCLSGGLDSSTVVCLTHEAIAAATDAADLDNLHTRWSQHTFTACLPGHALDESHFAETVVRSCGRLNWHRAEPTAEHLAADVAALMRHQEQPFGSPSIYMQWQVMRLAREHGVCVLLDGQGGDELFSGYEGCVPPLLAQLLAGGRIGPLIREFRAAVRDGHFTRRALAAHTVAALLPPGARSRGRNRINRIRRRWLDGDLFDAPASPGLAETLRLTGATAAPANRGRRAAEEQAWNLVLRDSLPALLRFEDRNSMAFSIEARVPLLDRHVVAAAMAIPAEEKIRNGRLKAALREAVRGVVPEQIVNRRDKIGFAAPTAAWMRGGLADWWREALTSKTFRQRGCFNLKGVVRLIHRFEAGDDRAALPLWRMAITEQWARQFLDGA